MTQLKIFLEWLNSLLGTANKSLTNKKLLIFCLAIFSLALLAKLLYWQDQATLAANNFYALAYDTEAERILEGRGILFPSDPPKSGDIRLLVHPPGYSILMAIFFALFGNSPLPLSLAQQFFDALSVVIIFLIALELFPLAVASIVALLAALSPHFAYYGLNLSPESITNLLLLLASLFLIKTIKTFCLKKVILVGLLIGLSCWFRPNALLLAPFLAIALLPFLIAKNRFPYVLTLVLTTAIVISPITIRNLLVFNKFVPISVGVGANMLEGIADYDLENRFGFPADDQSVAQADVKIYNRPDYAGNQWSPDGLMREQGRTKRAMEAIKSDPIWFIGVMLKRMAFMLTYNNKGATRWPLSTAIVPVLAAEPSFGHSLKDEGKLSWSNAPAKLATEGKTLNPQVNISLGTDSNQLTIIGDNSSYNDQFSSPIISVIPNTDYILRLKLSQQGQSAIKITSSDGRNILAAHVVKGKALKFEANEANEANEPEKLNSEEKKKRKQERLLALESATVKIPFASGARNEIKIILSNDGVGLSQTTISQIELAQLGATPYIWTKPFRVLIRGIQKNVYNTNQMLPLLIVGIILLAAAKRKQALALLLVIPLYFFCLQSPLHTEYRYIYLIHYFFFLISATTIYFIGKGLVGVFVISKNKFAK